MKNNGRNIKLTAGITALALTMSLMGGCSSEGNKFSFRAGDNGEVIVEEDSYIDYDYLNIYYVIEVLNKTTNNKEIYIAKKVIEGVGRYSNEYYKYVNIFNNFTLTYDGNDMIENKYNLNFISETPLLNYITSYYEIKYRYTYEDMQKIFEIVKEKYVLDNNIQNHNNHNKAKRRILI